MPGLGWDPAKSVTATEDMLLSGRYCTVGAREKIPPAWSLAKHRLASLEQGEAGTCWVHSPAQLAAVSAGALGYQAIPACRRLIGWAGVELMGGGNPSDGGSPTAAIQTMTAQGVGIADERLWPYTDDRNQLDDDPPQAVLADAKRRHLVAPVVVRGIDQGKQLISGGRPVANGVPWPGNWDARQTFMTTIGQIVGGHSVLWMGYVDVGVWDQYEWLQMDNWHGRNLYPALPADKAAKVPGYKPSSGKWTSDFWVSRALYTRLCAGQVTEHISATDMEGLKGGLVLPGPSFDEVIV